MSGCIDGPYAQTYDPPIACAIEAYERDSPVPQGPIATVVRDGQIVDVTGPVEDLGTVQLDRAIYTVDCDGTVVSESHAPEPYHHYRFTLSNVEVGENLSIDYVFKGTVMPAGPCPLAEVPHPSCSGMYDWSVCEGSGSDGSGGNGLPGDDGTGCNAGGTSMLGTSLALLALVYRRRRRA